MGDGAVDCLLKPFSEESLLKAISLALSAELTPMIIVVPITC